MEVVGLIGYGAGSTVYAVSRPDSGQIFALKHVVRTDDKSVRFIEQLENEYNVGKQVRHPNLRAIVDYQVHRSMMMRVTEAALVMELFDGAPLDLRQPTQISQILNCYAQTARAMHAMHVGGFVHCDLKPANILADNEWKVKVIDLGQACKVGSVKARIQGTPDYISPEQVKCKPVTPQTDVFNFGASLYWSLTGQKLPTLFTLQKGENSFLVDDFIAPPSKFNPFVTDNISSFVMECTRINPTKRPQNMDVVASRLDILEHTARKAEALRAASVA